MTKFGTVSPVKTAEEEALAVVYIGDKFGYINKAGEFVIEPQFDDAFSFSEGLANVRIDGFFRSKWGLSIRPASSLSSRNLALRGIFQKDWRG